MVTDADADALRAILASEALHHLHVVRRGQTLIVMTGPTSDPEPEARMGRLSAGLWQLDLRHHSGRWDPTPFTGDLQDLVDAALSLGRLEDDEGPWVREE